MVLEKNGILTEFLRLGLPSSGSPTLSSQVVPLPLQSVIHWGCKLLCSNGHLDRSRCGGPSFTPHHLTFMMLFQILGRLSYQRSQIHKHTGSPNRTITWRTRRFCLCNTHGLKREWKRQYRPTSGPWNFHLTEMKDDITCPKSGITSLKRGWRRKVLGPPMEGVGAVWGIWLAFPFVSNTIWRLRHTEEGCSCSWKLKKVSWKKILCYLVIGYWNYLHIW